MTEVKNKKTYDHIPDLISLIVRVRLEDKEGMHKKVALKPDDPRLISKTMAPVPPPTNISVSSGEEIKTEIGIRIFIQELKRFLLYPSLPGIYPV